MKALVSAVALGVLAVTFAQSQVSTKIKWACIGDKVTVAGYPARLQIRVLMDSVVNDGMSGATALKGGDSSYWKSTQLAQVFAYNPNVISIDLGANDSKPVNWGVDSANFVQDYTALVDTLEAMPSHPKIFLIYPTPVFKNQATPQNTELIRGSVIQNSIVPMIRQVAIATGSDTIDLNTPFLNYNPATYFPTDSLTPSTAMNDTLGAHIYSGLLAQSIRVVCIGNSITQYAAATTNTTEYPGGGQPVDAYPIKFNMLMGANYVMWNGGIVGDWMSDTSFNTSYKSYFNETSHLDSIYARKPSIVTIMLGTNDARPSYWNTKRYINSYEAFIDTLRNHIQPAPQFWLIQPPPSQRVNGVWPYAGAVNGASSGALYDSNGIDGIILTDSVFPAVAQVASAMGVNTIDLNTPFSGPPYMSLIPAADGVHPGKPGDDSIAHIIYRAVSAATSTAIYSQYSQPELLKSPNGQGEVLRYIVTPSTQGIPAGSKAYSLDGKSVSGQNLPAGVYLIQPEAKPLQQNSTPQNPNSGQKANP